LENIKALELFKFAYIKAVAEFSNYHNKHRMVLSQPMKGNDECG